MDKQAKLNFLIKRVAGMEKPPTQIDGTGCVAWIIPPTDPYTPSTTYLLPNTVFGKDGFPTLEQFMKNVTRCDEDGEDIVDMETICLQIPGVKRMDNFADAYLTNCPVLYSARQEAYRFEAI